MSVTTCNDPAKIHPMVCVCEKKKSWAQFAVGDKNYLQIKETVNFGFKLMGQFLKFLRGFVSSFLKNIIIFLKDFFLFTTKKKIY